MRNWILGGVAVVVVAGAAFFLTRPANHTEPQTAAAPAADNDVVPTLFQWESYMDPPFLADYKAKYGVEPNVAIFADEDEAFAKMRAGYVPDVMGPCYYEFPRWQEAGLLQPIDTSRLSNWEKISPTLRALPGIEAEPGKVWFVPHYWGNTSITYRTDLAPEYVGHESWDILFDPKYKGRVAVLEGVDDTVPFIAHMIGIDAYHMTPEEWEKVQAKLKELVPQLRFVSSDETTLAQGLASGEIVAAMSWRVTYATLKSQNVPVAYMNPPGGMFTYVCGLVMNKGAKDYDKALALIDSSLSDEASHYIISDIGDGPANTQSLATIPDEALEAIGVPRDVDNFIKSGIFQQRLQNKDAIVNAWAEIRAGL
jgi:spermidine/putrescine transport system substrate-binding protein